MQGVLIFFIVFVLFPGVILGFILLSRYLKYRETLTMIQHGITPGPPMIPPMKMPPPPMPRPPVVVQQGGGGAGRGTLIWGLVLAGIGMALTLALWPIGFIANSASGSVNFPLGLGPWMLAGFVPLFVGLALILGYVITRPERGSAPPPPMYAPQWEPAPGTPYGNGAPIIPTEPIVHDDVSEPVPPSVSNP